MRQSKGLILAIALLYAFIQFGALGTVVNAQRKSGADKGVKKGGKPAIFAVGSSANSSTSWTNEITESELENALGNIGSLQLVSRSALDTILKEQRLAQSDLVDPSKASEVGKLIGAKYVLIGKCVTAEKKEEGGSLSTKLGSFGSKKAKMNVTVQIQLVDVETGGVAYSKSFTDKAEANSSSSNIAGLGNKGDNKEIAQEAVYRDMMKKFASQVVGEMPIVASISGLVVLVKGTQVAIDQGENASVKPGMEFEVYSEGEPIKNAAGEVLSYDTTKYGKIKIVRVEPKLAWGEVVDTYNDNGQKDPSPNVARIKKDYAVKQVGK